MKKFLLKISFYISLIIIVHLLLASYADGNTDDLYLKFTSQKQKSLILGNSRALQGLIPDEFNSKIKNTNIYNYAFTIAHSPYGKVYLNAIKDKLEPTTKKGLFILAVDPWGISITKKDTLNFKEKNSSVGNTYCKNVSPNYEYLIKNYPNTWYYIYRDREEQGRSAAFLHDNGWLEVSVAFTKVDSLKNINEKEITYKENAQNKQLSHNRLKYLNKTIEYLQNHGTVYLVRLPQSSNMYKIEADYMPKFDSIMMELSNKNQVEYINFIKKGNEYEYVDGNHLYKTSSRKISAALADSIIKYQQK